MILLNIVTQSEIYDNYSYTSCVNWEIEKTPDTYQKKLKFDINRPEKGLKNIYFNISVNNNEIDDMNDDEIVHSIDDLVDDVCSNIEDPNSLYTLANNKLQLSYDLEDLNEANEWKSTNSHEDELVIAYNTNAVNNTLRPKIVYALYIGPNDDGNGHLIYKLSTD